MGELTCTVFVADGARFPNEQERVPEEIEHSGSSGVSDQEMPEPVGSASDRATPWAVPVPVFCRVMVNPMVSPAETVARSAVLVMTRFGQFTETEAWADWTGALFMAWVVAWFVYVAQVEADVGDVTWIATDVPGTKSPNEQLRVPLEMLQGLPPGCEAMDQLMPEPEGRASERVTPCAVPPGRVGLVTVMVNPMGSPADTLAASALLVICRAGHFTVTEAEAWTWALLVA